MSALDRAAPTGTTRRTDALLDHIATLTQKLAELEVCRDLALEHVDFVTAERDRAVTALTVLRRNLGGVA